MVVNLYIGVFIQITYYVLNFVWSKNLVLKKACCDKVWLNDLDSLHNVRDFDNTGKCTNCFAHQIIKMLSL